jgi:hypothetical protein
MTMTTVRAQKRGASRRGWLAGLVVGVASGFWLAEWPTFGLLLAIGFGVAALASGTRLAAVGGLLVGSATTWLAIMWLAVARCRAFDAQPGSECVSPDIGGWLVAAAVLLSIGIALTVAAARRDRWFGRR